jgi:hypothetical protein
LKTFAEVIFVSGGEERKSLRDSPKGDNASPAIVPTRPTTIVIIIPTIAAIVPFFFQSVD